MSKPMGRPKKVSTEEKIAIVNQYFVSQANEAAAPMQIHGIYKKLSQFSKEKGSVLEPHDFSRDEAVRNHIRHLFSITDQEDSGSAMPTYKPLDIPSLMTRSAKDIATCLAGRELYFEDLHKRASRSFELMGLASRKNDHLQAELSTTKSQAERLQAENEKLAQLLREAKKDVYYLTSVIKKNVEPDLAHQFLQQLISRDVVIEAARPSVTQSIRTLTHEDRLLQAEAAEDANKLDLKNLLQLL